MKLATRIIHTIVKASKTDSMLASAGVRFHFLNKFIPLPNEYSLLEYRNVIRDGARYRLDVSDYMQWAIYTNQPDYSWKFAAQDLKPGMVIFDIGANVGQFCLKIANKLKMKIKNFQVHAFEPNQFICSALSYNLNLNYDLKENVVFYPIGLGDVERETYFGFSTSNSGGGRISSEITDLKIPIVKLDNWFKEKFLTRVDFVKIDVEGYEPQVLLGGQEVIKNFRPNLYLEITDEWFKNGGYSSDFVFNLLDSWGYKWWVDNFGKLEHWKIGSTDKKKQFNILAKSRS